MHTPKPPRRPKIVSFTPVPRGEQTIGVQGSIALGQPGSHQRQFHFTPFDPFVTPSHQRPTRVSGYSAYSNPTISGRNLQGAFDDEINQETPFSMNASNNFTGRPVTSGPAVVQTPLSTPEVTPGNVEPSSSGWLHTATNYLQSLFGLNQSSGNDVLLPQNLQSAFDEEEEVGLGQQGLTYSYEEGLTSADINLTAGREQVLANQLNEGLLQEDPEIRAYVVNSAYDIETGGGTGGFGELDMPHIAIEFEEGTPQTNPGPGNSYFAPLDSEDLPRPINPHVRPNTGERPSNSSLMHTAPPVGPTGSDVYGSISAVTAPPAPSGTTSTATHASASGAAASGAAVPVDGSLYMENDQKLPTLLDLAPAADIPVQTAGPGPMNSRVPSQSRYWNTKRHGIPVYS